ncbi:MAG TPA: hypothetical protein ENK96_00350 [Desulfobulbaceae bacterium]|nr:hypothetical protein [Desulfobulbaceae bacterium]
MIKLYRCPGWIFLIVFFFFIGISAVDSESAASPAKQEQRGVQAIPAAQNTLQQDLLSRITEDIQQREYFFHRGPVHPEQSDKNIWQAPNRKHDLRVYAGENGVEILERRGEGKRLLQLKTVAFGRFGNLRSPGSGSISAHKNRLEIQRDTLSEWYINTEEGIEQGFTLPKKIAGSRPLIIELECDKQPIVHDDTHLVFASSARRPLDYGSLIVTDALENPVPAKFILLAENRFSIRIHDQAAVYPLTIDPIITSSYDSLLYGDQTNEYFGTSVADAGDVNGDGYSDIIVGAPNYDNGQNQEGAVFLFLGGLSGIAQTPSYHWEGEVAGAQFGNTLSGAGDVNGDGKDDFVVGTVENYPSTQGSAIVYYGDADVTNGLSHSGTIIGSGVNDKFAASVSGAGDVNGDGYSDIIIGAPGYGRNSIVEEGRAYLFYGSEYGIDTLGVDDFSFQNTGQVIDHSGYHFGTTVSVAGDINGDGYGDVLASTDRDDAGTGNEVYIYYGSSYGISTTPAFSEKIVSPQADSDFGIGLAAAGDLNGDGFGDIVIGAPLYDADGLTDQGALFIHFGSSSGLSSTISPLAFKSNSNGAFLGSSVSGSGDLNGDGYSDFVAGALGYNLHDGAIFIYHGTAAGAAYSSKIHLSDVGVESGASVAATGDVNGDGYADLVAGAPLIGVNHCGGVFVFHGGAALLDNTPDFFLESNQAGAEFGSSVSAAGDFNGDGYDDIIIGAPYFDKGQGHEGMAFLYYGPPGGLLWPFPLQLGGDVTNAYFGKNVAAAGDVNGDGYDDVIIGAPTSPFDGKAFIYYGDAFLNFPPKSFLSAGDVVSGAGDVNGDGFADVIVAAPDFDNFKGRVSLFLGSAHGIKTIPSAGIIGTHGFGFGKNIAGIGDINGDGYSDIAVGAKDYANGESGEGAVFIYHGSAHGLSATQTCVLESDIPSAALGEVSGAGDVNGDGFDDIIAGADGIGKAYLYLGSTTGLTNSLPIIFQGSDPAFGFRTSGAGDVNGDGFDDILVAATSDTVSLYFGKASGLDIGTPVVFQSNQNNSLFGYGLSGAGDVNGDGFADIVIGAERYDHGQTDEGAAFLYLGNSSSRPVRTTFLRKDDSHPIASRGLSYDDSGFALRMDLHSPRGKEKIRIEALVCPEIQPPPGIFNACDTFISPWQDGVTSYTLQMAGLKPGLYSIRARQAYAPYAAVTQGVYQPAHLCANNYPCPSSQHGPWRYLHGDSSESVIRIGMPKSEFPWPMFLPAIISGGK